MYEGEENWLLPFDQKNDEFCFVFNIYLFIYCFVHVFVQRSEDSLHLWFSPFILWVLGLDRRSSSLVASAFTHPTVAWAPRTIPNSLLLMVVPLKHLQQVRYWCAGLDLGVISHVSFRC